MNVHTYLNDRVHIWKAEHKLVLSFYHQHDPREQIQIVRFGDKCLHLPHLVLDTSVGFEMENIHRQDIPLRMFKESLTGQKHDNCGVPGDDHTSHIIMGYSRSDIVSISCLYVKCNHFTGMKITSEFVSLILRNVRVFHFL